MLHILSAREADELVTFNKNLPIIPHEVVGNPSAKKQTPAPAESPINELFILKYETALLPNSCIFSALFLLFL